MTEKIAKAPISKQPAASPEAASPEAAPPEAAPPAASKPKPAARTIVSEERGSDGSYTIVWSDGSVESGQGGG